MANHSFQPSSVLRVPVCQRCKLVGTTKSMAKYRQCDTTIIDRYNNKVNNYNKLMRKLGHA